RGLQAERRNRCAEDDRAIEVAVQDGRLASAVKHGDRDIEQEESDEEWLGARKVLGAVLQHAPECAEYKGESEARDVERSPGPEPGNAENDPVQDRKVAEQCDMIAMTRRSQKGS